MIEKFLSDPTLPKWEQCAQPTFNGMYVLFLTISYLKQEE